MSRQMRETHDLVVIGGGAAGLAAAAACCEAGIRDILLIERGEVLGGILNQCIHDGFGLHKFNESLTGPEYAQRYIDRLSQTKVSVMLDSMVIDLNSKKVLTVVNRQGLHKIEARAIVFAMGSRERTRGAIRIPGARVAGVYTAGVAQNLINMKDYMVGRKVIILGSGDIGLIMARRLTIEGALVQMVLEKLPYPSGLPRNINQCLRDFDIPLHLSHTVVDIHGRGRLSGVDIAEVDADGEIVENSRRFMETDTLLLSVGLIPENELSRRAGVALDPVTGGAVVDDFGQTSVEGIFSCGNVLQIHDLVDNVSLEAEALAAGVTRYLSKGGLEIPQIPLKAGENIRYCLPQHISGKGKTTVSFRPMKPGGRQRLSFTHNGKVIRKKRLLKANPAEMERIEIDTSGLEGSSEIRVDLVAEEQP
jgi:thioredoxin reductase